jgi:type II secretory pathway component PulJ
MASLDVPEMLIALGLLAVLAWGIYNWTHRAHTPR